MSAAARLSIFGAAMVAVFAIASFAGAALDAGGGIEDNGSHEEEAMSTEEGSHETGGHPATGTIAAPPPGLAVAEAGYRLVLEPTRLDPREAGTLAFRIADDDGETVTDFETEHERRMHLIVVRRDLSGFQHLHPEQRADGSWQTDLTVAEAGDYRVYADFATGGESLTLAADVFVPGAFEPRPLPPQRDSAGAGDGYRVALSEVEPGTLRFRITRAGELLRSVEPYLGADGHLVVLREGDGAFLHAHPLGRAGGNGPVKFAVDYPSAGAYRLYLQFQHEGKVRTAEFTRDGGHDAGTEAEAGEEHGHE